MNAITNARADANALQAQMTMALILLLENKEYNWTVTVKTVPKPTVSATAVPDTKDASSVHYIYIMQKGGDQE